MMTDYAVYAEWTENGEYHGEFFRTWENFYIATFNPEIELKMIVSWKNGRRIARTY